MSLARAASRVGKSWRGGKTLKWMDDLNRGAGATKDERPSQSSPATSSSERPRAGSSPWTKRSQDSEGRRGTMETMRGTLPVLVNATQWKKDLIHTHLR